MKYDFKKMIVKDINGKPLKQDACMALGNAIYCFTQDLGLLEIAKSIYKGETVELRENDIVEIKRVIDNPQSGLLAFARKAMNDFLQFGGQKGKG